MRKIIFIYIFWSLFLVSKNGISQGIHTFHETEKDTNTLSHFFGQGHFHGHARSFMAATQNQGSLSDYHAWGIGASIGYETPEFFRHFQLGLSGFFMFNLNSSNLEIPDVQTKQANRYEIGLFDIENPGNHKDLDRLEELFLKTNIGNKSNLVIGRQIPFSPFINPQDGRMSPTLIEAAVLEVKEIKSLNLHAEYIWKISPRATFGWYDTAKSIGIYPSGVGIDGKPSNYKGNLESAGVWIGGVTYQKQRWTFQLWDTYMQNLLNTSLIKAEWKSKINTGKNWFVGAQVISQQTVGNGGNADPSKAYAQKNGGAYVFSGRIGQQSNKFD